MKIVIVDDRPTNLKLLRFLLESNGHTVREALDGVEALDLLLKDPADAIISDILMPRMDGYRLCYEVRRNAKLGTIPFIFYTATYTSPGDEKLSLDMGGNKYLRKPASETDVLAALREVTQRGASAPVRFPMPLDEAGVMREYNDSLVAKLEEKNLELEESAKELQSAHGRLRNLLEHSPAVIYALKFEGKRIIPHVVSENVSQLLGFEVEETMSYDWWLGQLHPDDREAALQSISETIANGVSRAEYRIRHKDGRYLWVDDNRRLVRDAAGEAAELIGVWTDITERKRLEEIAGASERRFREMLENLELIAMTLDVNGVVTFCNDYLLGLAGWKRQEVIGHPWFDRFLPESEEATKRLFLDTVLSGKVPHHHQNPIRTRTGERREIAWNNTTLRDGAGNITGTASIGEDITERMQAERRLKLQHAVSGVLSEGATLEQTSRRIIEMVGQEMGWLLGELWTIDRVANTLQRSVYWHPPSKELGEFVDAGAKMTFDRGQGLTGLVWESGHAEWSPDITQDPRFRLRPLAGKFGLRGWIGFPIKIRDRIVGVIGFFGAEMQQPDDPLLATLTALGVQIGQHLDRQQLTEQIRQAQKLEAIGTLAGGVAHDFNNILTVIMGYAELMRMMVADDPKLLECVEAVGTAGSRATKLVRQILTFSRNEVSKRELLKLGPVLGEAVKFLRAAIPSAIEMETVLDADTPTVLADSTQVHQVVMNLGTNAWHAMKDRPGRIRFVLENVDVDADLAEYHVHVHPGKYVRLSVSDTGKGMDRATLNRIFEPFFTTKGPSEGTGLGLSVVHGIMQSHDGAVTVYSQPGEGTTFHLYFPALGGEALDPGNQVSPIPLGDGRRVLFVDDEEPITRLAETMLVRLGYVVETRTKVEDALELVRADPGRFDLVITDMTMPVMSGLDFARRLALIRVDLPIVLATGQPGGLNSEQVRAMGIRELLLKPPTLQSLGIAAHHALAKRGSI